MYDIAVIGAGIVGAAIARELSKHELSVVLLERNNDVGGGATAANSGIVYNGHTARPDKRKGRLTLQGGPMVRKLCRDLDVPYKPIDMLIVGYDDEDDRTLAELYGRAQTNGISGARLIDGDQVRALEPILDGSARAGLVNPDCGLIDPWELCIALVENAVENGVRLMLRAEVSGLAPIADGFRLMLSGGEMLEAGIVVNCAGLYADRINAMTASAPYVMEPKRGEYAVLDRNAELSVNHIISHCKTEKEKGIFVIPAVSGNIVLGPVMEKAACVADSGTTGEGTAKLLKSARKISPRIPVHRIIRTFTGMKAKCSLGDFLIGESPEEPGFIHAAGINSPGLTCSPAIALEVAAAAKAIRLRRGQSWAAKASFTARRSRIQPFVHIPDAAKQEWIRAHPSYGRIICRCEQVSEGEIRSSIRREAGAVSVKAVKKRTRAGMGRCQGGFCCPKVMNLLAEELGQDLEEIEYADAGSRLLLGPLP